GGAFLNFVQEHNAGGRFCGGQVHVGRRRQLVGQARDFEVVRGKQGQCLIVAEQAMRDGPGQGQTIIGGGAATNFIHQHQAVGGSTGQNGSCFGHFHHEGRAATGQIIRCTDTGKDAVDLTNTGCACRYKATDAGQQGNQGNLTHISGFTAHIRAGNQQHATLRVHFTMVGREALDAVLHHRVTACFNPDTSLLGQLGGDPIIVQCVQGQGGQGIQFGQGAGAQGQGACIALQLVQQFIEQELLAAQTAVLGGQDLVLPLFQFRRDEALGIFQCLAAAVVVGDLVGLTATDFNKETKIGRASCRERG